LKKTRDQSALLLDYSFLRVIALIPKDGSRLSQSSDIDSNSYSTHGPAIETRTLLSWPPLPSWRPLHRAHSAGLEIRLSTAQRAAIGKDDEHHMSADLQILLRPVSPDRPCGEDIMFSPEFDQIREARRHDDPSLEQGDWVAELKDADWPEVVRLVRELLCTRTKDIRLGAWVAEAWAKTKGFEGLRDGLLLVSELCDRYWDAIHPMAEDGDEQPRIGNLSWLLQRIRQLAREIPLTRSEAGGYGAADWESAAALANAIKRTPDKAAELAYGKTSLEDIERSRRDTPLAFYQALLASVPTCTQALTQLETVISRRLGDDAPSVAGARDTLNSVAELVQRFAKEAGLLVPAAAVGSTMAGATGSATAPVPEPDRRMEPTVPPMIGEESALREARLSQPVHPAAIHLSAIQNREQALALLREVAAFFRRTEPHSPVAYLADKAAGWGEMSLHLWLRTVMKEGDTLANMEELLGIQRPAD
jgi:type VI secretion system protein ImpA